MSEFTNLDDLKKAASKRGKDPKTRRWLYGLVALWLVTLLALLGVTWNAYFTERGKTQSLAQQIAFACQNGTLGPGISPEDEKSLCDNAEKVVNGSGEIQDDEVQESEIQESEVQESENQDPERQEPERQDPEAQADETQDAETQEDEVQDEETQDPEIQDEETQDPEIQDPEIDDPDPNDQIEAGSCTFDGTGTIEFTFETSSGPVTFQCTGTATPPGAN